MTMMMMMIKSPENPGLINSISNDPITTSISPTWKLYENPFYTHNHHHKKHHHHQQQHGGGGSGSGHNKIHRLNFPVSARKIAASFWDLTFIRPLMESELDKARNKITELKIELEKERKARKKAETVNKKIGRELTEERKEREALERLCEELAREISSEKEEINRMKRDMEEERKMLRVAEVLREERVQMKLADARILLEEKLFELETFKRKQMDSSDSALSPPVVVVPAAADKSDRNSGSHINRRKGSPEAAPAPETENHHIRRGIKGFVEFPKVVRAIGSKSKHLSNKIECQKAQLRILLKQKTSLVRSNNLLTS